MTQKTLAVVGAGPAIGMAMARRFGREGYRIGLIARNQSKLDGFVSELNREGVEAIGVSADVHDRAALVAGLQSIAKRFGSITALEYSPLIEMKALVDVLDLDVEEASRQIDFQLFGAMGSVQAVIGDMIARRDGLLFFTTGTSSIVPAPSHSNGSIGVVALRHYALMLHTRLRESGVYAGTISIGAPHAGPEIADMYWEMGQKRDRAERVHGEPRLLAAYEELVARGLGEVYPPGLKGELPAPRTARERDVFLVSLYHIYSVRRAGLGDAKDGERAASLAEGLGGNPSLPYFGVDLDKFYGPISLH